MLPAQFTTLWLGDPVAGVINFGSGAFIAWLLVGLLVVSALAAFGHHDAHAHAA